MLWFTLLACRLGAPEVAEAVPPGARAAEVVKPARREERWAKARCNDGTPWTYVIRKGSSPTWVIELSGGYFCDDETLWCRDRRRAMTTTRPEADGSRVALRGAGLFSPDRAVNPTFHDANHVKAHYCSSDLWLGGSLERQPTTGDPQGWWFSGRENVRVLVEALKSLHRLDEADPKTKILVVGTSAGGAGVVGNLDALVKGFPRAAADGRLKIVLDGAWIAPAPDASRLPNLVRWGAIAPACEAERQQRGEPPRICVQGPSWWPEVQRTGVPVLIAVSGLDVTQTPLFEIDTPAEQVEWQRQVRDSLVGAGVPWVYSAARPYHTVAFEELFSRGPRGSTFREVLDRFWAGGPPERVFLGYP